MEDKAKYIELLENAVKNNIKKHSNAPVKDILSWKGGDYPEIMDNDLDDLVKKMTGKGDEKVGPEAGEKGAGTGKNSSIGGPTGTDIKSTGNDIKEDIYNQSPLSVLESELEEMDAKVAKGKTDSDAEEEAEEDEEEAEEEEEEAEGEKVTKEDVSIKKDESGIISRLIKEMDSIDETEDSNDEMLDEMADDIDYDSNESEEISDLDSDLDSEDDLDEEDGIDSEDLV